MNTLKGSRGIALISFGGKYHAPATLIPDGRHCVHCTEGCVGLGVGLDGCENLAFPGYRTQKRPARSESLHQLQYHGGHFHRGEYLKS